MSSSSPANPIIWAVVPASGVGSRMQNQTPKQYLKIHNQTVLEHTLEKLSELSQIQGIVLVVNEQDRFYQTLNLTRFKNVQITFGGNTRAESVLNGLHFIRSQIKNAAVKSNNLNNESYKNTWALVHDCARPCVQVQNIQSLIDFCLAQNTGGILALNVSDTVKVSKKETQQHPASVLCTQDRSTLWLAQTPQFFKLTQLIAALEFCFKNKLSVTDEASAIENHDGRVLLIAGRRDNIKITLPEDLVIARAIFKNEN